MNTRGQRFQQWRRARERSRLVLDLYDWPWFDLTAVPFFGAYVLSDGTQN